MCDVRMEPYECNVCMEPYKCNVCKVTRVMCARSRVR